MCSYRAISTLSVILLFGMAQTFAQPGTVWSWGRNSEGVIGNGGSPHLSSPDVAINLSHVVSLKAGGWHMLGLRDDGTVWSWGNNAQGQLGDGSNTLRKAPVAVQGVSSVSAMGPESITVWQFWAMARWWLGVRTAGANSGTAPPATETSPHLFPGWTTWSQLPAACSTVSRLGRTALSGLGELTKVDSWVMERLRTARRRSGCLPWLVWYRSPQRPGIAWLFLPTDRYAPGAATPMGKSVMEP